MSQTIVSAHLYELFQTWAKRWAISLSASFALETHVGQRKLAPGPLISPCVTAGFSYDDKTRQYTSLAAYPAFMSLLVLYY